MKIGGNLYQLCSAYGLLPGSKVLINGPYDTHGIIISKKGEGIRLDSRFSTRYLIRGTGKEKINKSLPFAAK
jgi:hypothetical protein